MTRIDAINSYPISRWEDAVKNRPEIDFEEIHLIGGLVSEVLGFIIHGGKRYRAKWVNDGRCYYNERRAKQHDLSFN